MYFLFVWGILLAQVVNCVKYSEVNFSKDESFISEYSTDKPGLWRRFADGNNSSCMEFTLRIDRMLNAVANVDIGAMERFIEMDEYSLKNITECGLSDTQTLSNLYENAPGWGGETPLTILARNSLPRSSIMMQILSSKGLNFSKSQMNGYTPLILAIIYRNFGAVKVLLELAERQKYALHVKKSNIAGKDQKLDGINIKNTNLDTFDSINEVDSMGRTALYHAVLMEDENLVASLLNAGADPNIPDFSGITPLLLASKNNILVIVKLLLKKGANQIILDNKKRDPLSSAIKNNHPDIIYTLLKDKTFRSNYLNSYPLSDYKSHISRPTYHVRRLLDIFSVLQLKENSLKMLFRIEFDRNDTSLCDLRNEEGKTIVNIIATREMYDLLEDVLEFYKNASIYKYEGYTSCNPHILDKSFRGPVDYLLSGAILNQHSEFSLPNEIIKFRKLFNENSTNNTAVTELKTEILEKKMNLETPTTTISDRRQTLLAKLLILSNPLDHSSYLFELIKRGGNPTASIIKAMVNLLGDSKALLLHRTSRDGFNALTFALYTGQLTVAREILDILIDSKLSNMNDYKSALKLAISYSARIRTNYIIIEVALRKPSVIHEWICERRLNNVIEVEELKFVLLNLPADFVGFSKHPNLCKPLYTIIKQIIDPESQIESTEIVAIMLDTNGGLPFLDNKDVTMALKSIGTSLSISASFGLNLVPCTEWSSTAYHVLYPYKMSSQNCDNNVSNNKTSRSNAISGKFIIKYGIGTISSKFTGQRLIGTNSDYKRNQILDLVFSCPLRKVDPMLNNFQFSVLILSLVILTVWIFITSFVITYSSRSRLDIFGFVPTPSNSESDKLAFTLAEWKVYKLVGVLKFISLLYCIIILTTVGRVRHVLYTIFLILLGVTLRLNQILTLKGSDIQDIASAFVREEFTEKENNQLNKDLEDNDEVNDQNIGLNNNNETTMRQEDNRNEATNYGTFGEEFNASHSYKTQTDSRNTFQNDIIKKEHISAEEYAKVTLLIGICAFIVAISSNLQRYIFGNFREFYRFNESYNFVVKHTYIAISTEIALIINVWSLSFAILKAPGLIIFILNQRIQVVKYFLLAYPDINLNIFNNIKKNQVCNTSTVEQPQNSSQYMNLHGPISKNMFFIPPGRFDVVLCQWLRVRHAIMKRMHRRFAVASKPYNTIYFVIGFVIVIFLFKGQFINIVEHNSGSSLFHYMLFDEFGFTLLSIFAAFCITLVVIVWLASNSNQITEMYHWRLFWDAFSFMPPCSAQQIVLQHIKLTQELDTEDKRVSLWSIPITNVIRYSLLLSMIVIWVYIVIIGSYYTLFHDIGSINNNG
ncbi:hypothetical protein FG386_003404 [Cryptosporidium ryanae]|uniref:uncharacterized protein n=1 Tax=Cryptosporidium ryanae TaxID=515981 RepID=UPI00351A4B25|nr:hypothetical protein FG386_003404 [Cryptosporidium ryanae]